MSFLRILLYLIIHEISNGLCLCLEQSEIFYLDLPVLGTAQSTLGDKTVKDVIKITPAHAQVFTGFVKTLHHAQLLAMRAFKKVICELLLLREKMFCQIFFIQIYNRLVTLR